MSKILSINGNKSMNYLVKNVLAQKWDVLTASKVSEGIEMMKKHTDIELIIIDVDRFTKENISFINYIKSSWMYQRPVLVLCSDCTLPEGLEYDLSDHFLQKPFNPADLLAKASLLAGKIHTTKF